MGKSNMATAFFNPAKLNFYKKPTKLKRYDVD